MLVRLRGWYDRHPDARPTRDPLSEDDDEDQDSFGFGTVFNDVGGGPAGPLVRGDPNNFPRGDCTASRLGDHRE